MNIASVNIRVKSVEESIRYYTEALGFESEFSHGNEDGSLMYADLTRGEARVLLSSLKDVPEEARPFTGTGVDIMFNVKEADIDEVYGELKKNGARIAVEIEDKFWGHREFVVEDLDGYRMIFTKHVKEVDFSDKEPGSW